MRPLNAGNILITSSIAGEMVAPREAVYAATKAFDLSFAHSLRYELRDTGISVTALQPGPTDTDFFHRAGMDNTETGKEGKHESEPEDVARQGLDALFAGKDHIYAASFKTKMEGCSQILFPAQSRERCTEKDGKARKAKSRDPLTRKQRRTSMPVGQESSRADQLPHESGAASLLNGHYAPPPEDRDGKLWVRTSVVVQLDAQRLYDMWRDIESSSAWRERIVSGY